VCELIFIQPPVEPAGHAAEHWNIVSDPPCRRWVSTARMLLGAFQRDPKRRAGVTAEALPSRVTRLEGQPRSYGHSVSLSIETPCR
jgi:hypothetical protein